MQEQRIISIVEYFEELTDLRMDRGKKHDLIEIIIIAICTVIASGEGWEGMEEFGSAREEWLRRVGNQHYYTLIIEIAKRKTAQ